MQRVNLINTNKQGGSLIPLKPPLSGGMGSNFKSKLHLSPDEGTNWFFVVGVIILVLILGGWGVIYYFNYSLDKQSQQLDGETASANAELNKHQYYANTLSVLADQVKSLNKLIDSHVYASNALALVEVLTLKNVQWTKFDLNLEKHSIGLDGVAPTYSVFAEQATVLGLSPDVANIKYPDPSLNSTGIAFHVDLVLKASVFKNTVYQSVKSLTIPGVEWNKLSYDPITSQVSLTGQASSVGGIDAQISAFKKADSIVTVDQQQSNGTTFNVSLNLIPMQVKSDAFISVKSLLGQEIQWTKLNLVFDHQKNRYKLITEGQTHENFSITSGGKTYEFNAINNQKEIFKNSRDIEQVIDKSTGSTNAIFELILNPAVFGPK